MVVAVLLALVVQETDAGNLLLGLRLAHSYDALAERQGIKASSHGERLLLAQLNLSVAADRILILPL